ncbi:hypothetical protein [Mycolicibacterium alvei]|uniref:Uncharacterized protein n=1 Tax=Mycolicibacterium alvei TaxID=67081 RepID=A0A6N4UVM4_9MYCO|nr:hypothetical protein [Mycolicibacterium alvei]MCV7001581.1 hypothetical protein [Mycolicibacterium alvei]BBX28488.1 hypothetical protein MALV_36130 [Mycolicibacterium alvei]
MPNSATDPQHPLLVVFDTSTQTEFYADVHRVLASPAGAVLPYDYERRLTTSAAAQVLDELAGDRNAAPVDVLLMYGERRGFRKGDSDPTEMLRSTIDTFIPTRSARIVSVSSARGAEPQRDVFKFHLELRGFIDPRSDAVQALVAALEQENALPFGDRATQFSWIATLPEDLAATRNALVSDSQDRWAAVIDRFHERDTQFSDDVFWRVRSVRRIAARSSDNDTLSLRSRRTNIVGDPDAFQRDYRIAELGKYEVSIQTHTPGPTQRFPAGATVAFTPVEDEDGSIKLSPAPSVLRPEGNVAHRFTVATSGSPATRYPRMLLETQPPNWESKYPPGSTCTLTFAVRKPAWRWVVGILCIAGIGTIAGCLKEFHLQPTIFALCAVGAAVLVGVGWWAWSGQFKFGKGG